MCASVPAVARADPGTPPYQSRISLDCDCDLDLTNGAADASLGNEAFLICRVLSTSSMPFYSKSYGMTTAKIAIRESIFSSPGTLCTNHSSSRPNLHNSRSNYPDRTSWVLTSSAISDEAKRRRSDFVTCDQTSSKVRDDQYSTLIVWSEDFPTADCLFD